MSSVAQRSVSNRLQGQALRHPFGKHVLINLLNSYANRCFLVSLSCDPPARYLCLSVYGVQDSTTFTW